MTDDKASGFSDMCALLEHEDWQELQLMFFYTFKTWQRE